MCPDVSIDLGGSEISSGLVMYALVVWATSWATKGRGWASDEQTNQQMSIVCYAYLVLL